MRPWCTLCFRELELKVSESASPVVPPCGHVLCYECLKHADKHPCYFRCGQITLAEEARPIRMKLTSCSNDNWQELLSSKAKKSLKEANASLEKLGAELDKERARLAQSLGGFGLGGSFEATLHGLADNLTGLEGASIELYPQILVYSKRLERLEAEIKDVKKTKESTE